MGDERRVAEAGSAGRRCRPGRTSDRSSHATIADGGTTHSSVSNGRRSACGIEPRVELHGAERHVLGPQVVDRGDDRAGRVVARLGLVPVGGAVVGPVRGPGRRGRRPTGRGARCRPGSRRIRPHSVEAGPRAVAGDHREVGARSRRATDGEVAVPAAADGAAVEADGLVVEGVERGDAAACGRRARRAAAASRSAAGGGAGRSRRGRRRRSTAGRTRSAGRRGRAGRRARRRRLARRA